MDFADEQLSDNEAVAIISAAVREILSRKGSTEAKIPQDLSAWRFSGRWWNHPVPIGRSRPTLR